MKASFQDWITRLGELMAEGTFVRYAGILAGGTIIAQAFTMAVLPILTRLYTPEDFNLLAAFAGVVSILSVVANLRYNMAIPLPERDEDGFALTTISLIASLLISLGIAVAVWIFPSAIVGMLRQPDLRSFLWVVPIAVFAASSYNALQYWASRKKRFGLVARTRIVRSLGGAGTQIGFGVASPSPFGLVAGQIVSEGLGIVGLVRTLIKEDRKVMRALSIRLMQGLAHDYRRFPIYSGPEALFNTAAAQLPIILIAAVAIGPEAGFLLIAMRVMGIPTRLIGTSVAQVFVVQAPARMRDGDLHQFTQTTLRSLLKIGTPPLLLIGIVAPWMFPWIFGAEWTRAGWLVAWLTPMFILQFVASPISVVLHVIGKLQLAMWMQVFGLIFRVGTIISAAAYMADHLSEAFALAGAVYYLVFIAVIIRAVRNFCMGSGSVDS